MPLLTLNLHDKELKIRKVDSNYTGNLFTNIPFGDEHICKIISNHGDELRCCKILQDFAINQLLNFKYKTLNQWNNLERLQNE